TTEVGAAGYVELNSNGKPAGGSVAAIEDGRLVIHGVGGDVGRVFLRGIDTPDVTVRLRAAFRASKDRPVYDGEHADRARNTLGIMLRVGENAPFGHGEPNDQNTGFVTVEMLNNGGLVVRERQAGGQIAYITDKSVNPLTGGPMYDYLAGKLGAQRNGRPFDRDDDGMLEANEPFDLAVSLVGD